MINTLIMLLKRANPKTKKLLKLTGSDRKLRLLAADRAFLKDLSRLQILSDRIAIQNHYRHLKGGAVRSLGRLEAAGIIVGRKFYIPRRGFVKIYQFSSDAMARAWGGRLPAIGAKRNELHELITSELYYKIGKPEDFRLAHQLTNDELSTFNGHRPDAVFTDTATGQPVAVEADSGHYNKQQVMTKLAKWKGLRQVWGQPERVSARIPSFTNVAVHVLK
ncbi:MAG: hypothetical protein ACE5FY_05945 [Nitrospiria bacterium]